MSRQPRAATRANKTMSDLESVFNEDSLIDENEESLFDEINYYRTLSTDYIQENGSKEYRQNYEALAELKKKQLYYNNALKLFSGTLGVGLLLSNPWTALLGSIASLSAIDFSIPVDRSIYVMEKLLEHFGNEGITLTPDVRTELGKIELLIKMPDRRTFALILRSKGNSLIKWKAEAGKFFVRTRTKSGRSSSAYDELMKSARRLNEMTLALKKEKSALLGTSNAEKKQPIAKVIVLTSKTKIDPNNDPALFVDFGRARVLHVRSDCSIYVVNHEDLIDFLLPDEKIDKLAPEAGIIN